MERPRNHRDRKKESEGSKELGGLARSMREAEPYLQAVWSLVGALVLGALAGHFADRKLGTGPWLLLLGTVFGMTAGIYAFIKAILAVDEKRKAGR